jgi:hypothetical protein
MLQTRDYAREIIHQLGPESETRANGLFEFRMRRQELLDLPKPPSLSFVLDESVLHRRVGSVAIMRDQFGRLIELAGRSHITILIHPFTAGLVRRMQTPFVIHQFSDTADPDVLYLEGPRGDTVVAFETEEIGRYRLSFEELRLSSLSGAESVDLIKEGMNRLH